MRKSYESLQNDYDRLRSLHNAMVAGVEAQNKELEALRIENVFYKEQLANADRRVDISKDIVSINISQSQEEITKLSNEIIALHAEVKRLNKELRN